jgi:hypothetical protein
MPDFATTVLTKVALGLVEVIVTRLLWQLWTAYARSPQAAAALAA